MIRTSDRIDQRDDDLRLEAIHQLYLNNLASLRSKIRERRELEIASIDFGGSKW